jgi:hypothetical protein
MAEGIAEIETPTRHAGAAERMRRSRQRRWQGLRCFLDLSLGGPS